MPRMSAPALNAAVNAVLGLSAFTSLHTADPSTTGASEGASVTRQASSWNTASGGAGTNSAGETFTTPGTTPYTHFGEWSAQTGGTFEFAGLLGSSVQATTITVAAGALSLTGS